MNKKMLVVRYHDQDDLPRAYAVGPASEEVTIRKVAAEMLAEYCKAKNKRIEDFTMKAEHYTED